MVRSESLKKAQEKYNKKNPAVAFRIENEILKNLEAIASRKNLRIKEAIKEAINEYIKCNEHKC